MSPEERNRDLGKRIELARRAVNLTQGELAEKMSAETGIPISNTRTTEKKLLEAMYALDWLDGV